MPQLPGLLLIQVMDKGDNIVERGPGDGCDRLRKGTERSALWRDWNASQIAHISISSLALHHQW